MKNTLLRGLAALSLIGLSACSSSPAPSTTTAEAPAEKKAASPPMPVAAKEAYYDMYDPAHQWATDLVGMSLVSGEVPGVKNADGKAGLWTAVFGSPSMRMSRTYTYAVADSLPSVTKGVKADDPVLWAGPTTKAMPFDDTDFKIDSDAAYTTAMTKAGDWVKDHPDKTLVMTLGNASSFPNPVWYFLWGDTKSGFAVFVNATTGTIIKK